MQSKQTALTKGMQSIETALLKSHASLKSSRTDITNTYKH